MSVECTIYTGPIVVVTPPEVFEEVKRMRCETCDRRQMGEGAYCSRDGGKFVLVIKEQRVAPGNWACDLEDDNNIVDYFTHLSAEGGVEIPDDEIWLIPNQSNLSYCKFMNDPCRGRYRSEEKSPYQLTWIKGDSPVTNPDDMLNEFLADEEAQATVDVYRKAGAEVTMMVATVAWCS
jgi:hypothetical protein